MKTSKPNDREIFTRALTILLQPHLEAAISEQLTAEQAAGVEQPIQEFLKEVNTRLLNKFYDLAQTDTRLGLFMVPIMAHLRKMPLPPEEVKENAVL